MKRDTYQDVTDRIIKAIEAGTPPWVRPWKCLGQSASVPINGRSRKPYRGVNVWLLTLEAMGYGYTDGRWFTFKQALDAGGHVRKGERGTWIIFWKQTERTLRNVETGEDEKRKGMLLRSYCVFNAQQCDGIEPIVAPQAPSAPGDDVRRVAGIFEQHGVNVKHGGDQAAFSPMLDFIMLPKVEQFEAEHHYCSTALHELTHWTGHHSRLNRDLSGRFGGEAYAAEELVAEIGSAFMCARLGIDGSMRHPEYVKHWLGVLKADNKAIFKASTLAQNASDYILGAAGAEAQADETSNDEEVA